MSRLIANYGDKWSILVILVSASRFSMVPAGRVKSSPCKSGSLGRGLGAFLIPVEQLVAKFTVYLLFRPLCLSMFFCMSVFYSRVPRKSPSALISRLLPLATTTGRTGRLSAQAGRCVVGRIFSPLFFSRINLHTNTRENTARLVLGSC